MSLDVGAVTGAMRHLLLRVVEAAAAANVELPERQYITTGGAIFDCPQVVVSANQITTGVAATDASGQAVGVCPPGWQVQTELSVVRPVREQPQGRRGNVAPTVEDVESDTAVADSDAAILTQAVETIAGSDWDQYGQVPASLQFGEVQGGLTAVVLTVTLNLWEIPVPELMAP